MGRAEARVSPVLCLAPLPSRPPSPRPGHCPHAASQGENGAGGLRPPQQERHGLPGRGPRLPAHGRAWQAVPGRLLTIWTSGFALPLLNAQAPGSVGGVVD